MHRSLGESCWLRRNLGSPPRQGRLIPVSWWVMFADIGCFKSWPFADRGMRRLLTIMFFLHSLLHGTKNCLRRLPLPWGSPYRSHPTWSDTLLLVTISVASDGLSYKFRKEGGGDATNPLCATRKKPICCKLGIESPSLSRVSSWLNRNSLWDGWLKLSVLLPPDNLIDYGIWATIQSFEWRIFIPLTIPFDAFGDFQLAI